MQNLLRILHVMPLRRAFNVSRTALLLCALATLAACSSNTTPSTVSMTFPDWKEIEKAANQQLAQTASVERDRRAVQIIAINITAADMEPVIYIWHRDDDNKDEVPRSFKFPVTQGKSRLVQVLAVYGGEHSTQFIYGDTRVDVVSTEASASVTLALKNTLASGIVEGNTVGRYLSSTGAGPTGIYEYHFDPDQMPGGIPSMIVSHGEIFGGWFRSFMLSTRLIQYKVKSGNFLFDLSDNSQMFSDDSPKAALRVRIPRSYYDKDGTGDTNQLEESPIQWLTVGYFGPGAQGTTGNPSNYRVCYDNTASRIPNLYFDKTTLSVTNQIQWVGHTTVTADFDQKAYIMTPSKGQGAGNYATGGDPATTCAQTGTKYDEYLNFDASKLMSGDELLGFRGPFLKSAAGKYLEARLDGTTAYLEWNVLPGSVDQLKGFTLFYRETASSSVAHSEAGLRSLEDGYDCNRIASSREFKSVFIPAAGPYQAAIMNVPDANAFDKIQVLLCPQSLDGPYFNSAVQIQYNLGSGTSVAGTPGLKVLGAFGSELLPGVIPSGTKFSKSIFNQTAFGDYTYFVPTTNGKLIPLSSVSTFQVSLDNSNWYQVSPASTYGSASNFYAAYSLSSIKAMLSGLTNPVSDQSLYVKWSVTAAYQASESLTSADFSAPTMNISATCTAGTELALVDGNNVVKPSILNDFINVSNATDLSFEYRLRYASSGMVAANCGDVTVPVAGIDFSNETCFGRADVQRKPNDLFSILIDPKDSTGDNCDLTGLSIAIRTPYENGTASVSKTFASGDVIPHSTAQFQAGAFVSSSDLGSNVINNRLKLQMALTGNANGFGYNVVALNKDGKVVQTSRYGIATMPTPVQVTQFPDSHGSSISGNRVTVSIAALATSLTTGKVSSYQFTSGSAQKPGSFEALSTQDSSDLVGTAALWGSELLVKRDASNNVRLLYVYRNGSGSALDRSLIDITPSTGINTTGKVYVVPSPISSGSAAAFTLVFENSLYYGALYVSGNTLASVYSPALILPAGTQTIGVYNRFVAGQWIVSVLSSAGLDLRLTNTNSLPVYSGTAINNPVLAGSTSTLSIGTIINAPLAAQCAPQARDGHLFVVTTPTSGTRKVYHLVSSSTSSDSVALAKTITSTSDDYDAVTCIGIPRSTDQTIKLLTLSKSVYDNSNLPVYSFDDESGSCGAGPNSYIAMAGAGLNNVDSRVVAPYRDLTGSQLRHGFLIGSSTASEFKLRRIQFSNCSASIVNFSDEDIGALPQTNGRKFLGLSNDVPWQSSFSVFGQNGQYFKFDLAN